MHKSLNIYWLGLLLLGMLAQACQTFDLPRQTIIHTGEVTQIDFDDAVSSGNLVDVPADKRAQIKRFGHCWNSVPAPTITDQLSERTNLDSLTSFVSKISSLEAGTTYYVRTYIDFGNGEIVYGNELNFTTLTTEEYLNIIVRMGTMDNITSTSAQANAVLGVLVSRNIDEVTEHGFRWSDTKSQPTLADNVLALGKPTQAGAINASLTGLKPDTQYFIRAYVTGIDGKTAYSFDVTNFTTQP